MFGGVPYLRGRWLNAKKLLCWEELWRGSKVLSGREKDTWIHIKIICNQYEWKRKHSIVQTTETQALESWELSRQERKIMGFVWCLRQGESHLAGLQWDYLSFCRQLRMLLCLCVGKAVACCQHDELRWGKLAMASKAMLVWHRGPEEGSLTPDSRDTAYHSLKEPPFLLPNEKRWGWVLESSCRAVSAVLDRCEQSLPVGRAYQLSNSGQTFNSVLQNYHLKLKKKKLCSSHTGTLITKCQQ